MKEDHTYDETGTCFDCGEPQPVSVRKGHGDYINARTGRIHSGNFWEIKQGGYKIKLAGSRAKKDITEFIHGNLGRGVQIDWS